MRTEPRAFGGRPTAMTITLTPRRTATAIIVALAFIVAYLLGTWHSGGSVASAATTSGNGASGIGGSASIGAAAGYGQPTGITVTGLGKVTGKPDTLVLDLGVTANGSTVSTALASASSIEARVQKALRSGGVADRDLQTSGLSIQPDYTYGKSGQPIPRGYVVTEDVTAKLRDLGRAGQTITSAVAAGGNSVRLGGISLDLQDTSALVSSARDSAFGDAKAKAEQYARAAGRSLGPVISISEVVTNPTPVYPYGPMMGAASTASAPVPIAVGSQDVNVTVTVVFAFG
jgi:uncharacterized protein YggE